LSKRTQNSIQTPPSSSSEEEEDYMSDTFLTQIEKSTKTTTLLSRCEKRLKLQEENEQIKRQKLAAQIKPDKKKLEHDRRDQGLNNKISENNIGFKLMLKMGYKSGNSLGKKVEKTKDDQKSSDEQNDQTAQHSVKPLLEPLSINLNIARTKQSKLGIGHKTKQEIRREQNETYIKKLQKDKIKFEKLKTQFQSEKSQKFSSKLYNTLTKIQRTCQNLDSRNGKQPKMDHFWPNDDEYNEPVDEQIDQILNYLRTEYCYCFYCGIEFNDEDDMDENCPGFGFDVH